MVQVKPADAERLLATPDPAVRVVLIYGPDEGLVAERAERFADAALGAAADPMARLRIDAGSLPDPSRLLDEANAMSLFGGERVITVRAAGNRAIEPVVGQLLKAPPRDAWIVVTAGELRKTSPLRKLCESSKAAWAVPSYTDGDRDLDRLIDEEAAAHGVTIADDARAALKRLIGSDRMVSRSEIRKLCLYATDAGTIALDDVRAVIGDAGTFAVDETLDAAALGNAAALDVGYRRLLAAGTPGFVVAGAALRHFNFLEKARARYDAGEGADAIVRRAIPPVFFSRQSLVARQIALWPASRISRALAILDQAMLDSRLHGTLDDSVIGQALQLVAALAPQSRRP